MILDATDEQVKEKLTEYPKAKIVEMNPEKAELYTQTATKMYKMLEEDLEGPMDAMIVLEILRTAILKTLGIKDYEVMGVARKAGES